MKLYLLDAGEDDAELSPPLDNADGALDRGWSAYLTVYSRESNRRRDGSKRIHLNHKKLVELYDQLEAEFDEDAFAFPGEFA